MHNARRVMWWYIISGFAVFVLMAIVGFTMKIEQAQWVSYGPDTFYSLMTLHAMGMIAGVALCAMGIIWYVLRSEGPLDERVAYTAYALTVAGVAGVIVSVLVGHFGAAWTFLYPLPFVGATWPSWATGAFLMGTSLVTIGWTVWCTQIFGCVVTRYGGIRGALAWDYVFHRKQFEAAGKHAPPPQALAAAVVAIDGLLTGAAGMVIGIALFAHWLVPSIVIDPLWAKNVTYFFGHSIANLTIYMAITAVYTAIPKYARREYHTSVALVVAWWATLLFVATAYFHHLYMDFSQFRGLQFIGEIASYGAAIPTVTVTIFGAAMLVYRSGMRWSLGSLLLYAGLIGWAVGGSAALLDATVPLNVDLHNTLWVPAHFHTYLLEGVMLFIFGWIFFVLEDRSGRITSALMRWVIGSGIFGGGALFLLGFYAGGADGVPRRYAMEPAPGPAIASWASIGAIILFVGIAALIYEAVRLAAAPKTAAVPTPQPALRPQHEATAS
jgi:cytochrome c oxidase subunit 1